MENHNSPAFQFYPKDWLTDSRVVSMTTLQRGIYIQLLCYCWLDGWLPMDPKKLSLLSGAQGMTEQEFLEHWEAIEPCFEVATDGKGFTHPRLEKERVKQQQWRDKCSKGGKISASRRQLTGNTAVCSLQSSSSKDLNPLEHPETDAPTEKQLRESFEDIWDRYPEKKGKEKAWLKFKHQVTTAEAWDNINLALHNYTADIEYIRGNGHPDRAWQHGSTWFNENWKDFVDYQPPPLPVKIVNGLPLPDEEPRPHNELVAVIVEQMAFCEEHMADTEWEGAAPDLNWLNMTVGHLILEYSERFPKGPHIDKYSAWLDHQTEIVLTAGDST